MLSKPVLHQPIPKGPQAQLFKVQDNVKFGLLHYGLSEYCAQTLFEQLQTLICEQAMDLKGRSTGKVGTLFFVGGGGALKLNCSLPCLKGLL